MPQTTQTMTPKELAAVLRVSVRTLQNHTRDGDIPHIRIGRSFRYPRQLVSELLMETGDE
jgi:excisionase family DNA binding protein